MNITKIYQNSIVSSMQNMYIFLFTIGIYFVYIPWNLKRLNLVETDLGLWLFIFGIFNLLSNQITGRIIAPKIGSKNIIIIGTIILSICPFLLVSVNSYSMFMLVALPFGIAIGFVFPTNQSLVSYIESKTKKIYTPLYQACMSAGSLSGALVAAYVIKKDIDPQVTFAVMGTIILLSAIVVYFLGMPRSEENNDLVDKFRIPEKKILIFGILLMMNFATLGIIIDWSSLWLTKDLMAPLFLGGLVIVFFNAGEIIARLVASFIINSLGEKFVGGYLPVIGSLVLFVSILTSNLYIIIPALVLFGLFTANFISVVIRQAIKVTTEPISLAVSNLTTLGFSGFIFGPAIVGYTAKNIGLTFNMYILCVVWALSAIFLIKMIRAEEYSPSAS
jgi:predicted MFS family arabinose efflux permease